MLIREAENRPLGVDIRLAALFAAAAGAVNAAGFLATGYFSANMTGNVSAFSDELALGRYEPARFLLALLAAFIAGAFVSGVVIELGRKTRQPGIYAMGILAEAGLLLALGLADISDPTFGHGISLPTGLSFAMGLQNAATTRISNARVRSTHVSGMATDVGLGIAALLAGTADPTSAGRLQLYGVTLGAFLVGGIFGALVYQQIGGWLFFVGLAASGDCGGIRTRKFSPQFKITFSFGMHALHRVSALAVP